MAKTYTTQQGDAWDAIAHKVYGSETYTGWLILPPIASILATVLPMLTQIISTVLPVLANLIAALLPVITPLLEDRPRRGDGPGRAAHP